MTGERTERTRVGKSITRRSVLQTSMAASFLSTMPVVPNAHMQDDELAAKLWQVSEELTADYLS